MSMNENEVEAVKSAIEFLGEVLDSETASEGLKLEAAREILRYALPQKLQL